MSSSLWGGNELNVLAMIRALAVADLGVSVNRGEMVRYLDGELSFPEAVSLLRQSTRHFAKRQLTWFRREKEVLWVDKDRFSDQSALEQYLTGESKKIL